MKLWMTSFLVLFGLVELYQWMQGLHLPMPVFIAGGIFLAIASNADKRSGFAWIDQWRTSTTTPQTRGSEDSPVPSAEVSQPSLPASDLQLPNFQVPQAAQPARPISFTIRRD